MKTLEKMSESVMQEFMYFMTGAELGSGLSRKTYLHPTDPTKVIKVENSAAHFQNVMEWEAWNEWKHYKKVSRWLAPCHSISYSGTFLIMEYCEDLTKKTVPKTLPAFLTDHKLGNYGLLDGRVVCRDYGFLVKDLRLKQRRWNPGGSLASMGRAR